MSEKEPSHVSIKGMRVGIVGLKQVLEDLSAMRGQTDEELADALSEKLKAANYIPPTVAAEYRKAFLREFKKFIGEPFPEEKKGGLTVLILGPGCPNCDRLEQTVMAVLAEENIPAEVEHVRDVVEIARYGVMGTPALVINGRIKSSGLVPNRNQVAKWLEEEVD
ncbi:MAG: MTH895/ArsE family thioredoxin-like protein [Pseudomonadota bacterium]